jgi:creatinine amidohydrolase
MKFAMLRPEQIRAAVQANLPVLMAAGVMEYHGPHLPIGTDFLIANSICEAVEQRVECVLFPPLPYGPTLSWAAGAPDGEMDFDPEPFFQYAREMFRHITAMGFRRIYVLQHHQGPEGLQALNLKRAAMEVVREISAAWGPEWGRLDPAALPVPDIFSMIQVAALDTFSQYPGPTPGLVPVGHAGKGETQLIMGAYPETVRMEALNDLPFLPEWLRDADQATQAEGRLWLEFCIAGWVRELAKGQANPPAAREGEAL